MLFLQRIPKLLRWIFSVVLLLLVTMTIFRFIFYWKYNPPGKAFSGSAFLMGLRFDARIVCIIGLAMMLLTFIPFLNPFKNSGAKKIWNFLLPLVFAISQPPSCDCCASRRMHWRLREPTHLPHARRGARQCARDCMARCQPALRKIRSTQWRRNSNPWFLRCT